MAIECPTLLENLINDFDTFVNGAAIDDVTLSDAHVMPSYRKFSIGELDRVGKTWDITKTYLEDDIVTKSEKLYTAKVDNIGKDPEIETLSWEEITKDGTTEGIGISAYVTFFLQDYKIAASKEVDSVTSISTDEFEVTVSDKVRVGAGNKLVYAFSFTSEDIDQNHIVAKDPTDDVFRYFVYGRTVLNEDNKVRISFNKEFIDWNAKFDLVFLEV